MNDSSNKKGITFLSILSLITMLGVYCISSIYRVGVPGAIFDVLQKDFHTTAGTISLLGVSFTVVYGLDMLIIGPLADKFGGMRMLLTGTLILLSGSLAFVLSRNTFFLIGSRLLLGFGAGFIYLSLVKELTKIFAVKYFAVVMGFVYATSSISNLLSTYPLVYSCEKFSWRTTFSGLTILLGLLFSLFIILFKLTDLPKISSAKISLKSYLPVFRNIPCLKVFYCSACNLAIYLFVQGVIGKKFLEDITHCSPGKATGVIFICTIITSLEMMFAGSISYLIKNRRKPFLVLSALQQFISCAILIAGILFQASFEVYAFSFFMMASGYGFSGIYTATVRDMNPEKHTALAVGVLNAIGNAFVAIFSLAGGILLDCFHKDAFIESTGIIHYPPQAYLMLWSFIIVLVLPMLFWCIKTKETFAENDNVREVVPNKEMKA